jgi:hypothetical protein
MAPRALYTKTYTKSRAIPPPIFDLPHLWRSNAQPSTERPHQTAHTQPLCSLCGALFMVWYSG